MGPGSPSRIPSIRPIDIRRMTYNITTTWITAPSQKQSTWDWIQILGDIGGDHPHRHPTR